jgi:hypothetical protein
VPGLQIQQVSLPYALDALEPEIDNATMNFHVSNISSCQGIELQKQAATAELLQQTAEQHIDSWSSLQLWQLLQLGLIQQQNFAGSRCRGACSAAARKDCANKTTVLAGAQSRLANATCGSHVALQATVALCAASSSAALSLLPALHAMLAACSTAPTMPPMSTIRSQR